MGYAQSIFNCVGRALLSFFCGEWRVGEEGWYCGTLVRGLGAGCEAFSVLSSHVCRWRTCWARCVKSENRTTSFLMPTSQRTLFVGGGGVGGEYPGAKRDGDNSSIKMLEGVSSSWCTLIMITPCEALVTVLTTRVRNNAPTLPWGAKRGIHQCKKNQSNQRKCKWPFKKSNSKKA